MPLKNLLGDALQRKPVQDGVRAAVVLDAAREALEILPEAARTRVTLVSFRDGILTLATGHTALIQEIRMYETELITLLSERLGAGIVKSLRIKRVRQQNEDMLG